MTGEERLSVRMTGEDGLTVRTAARRAKHQDVTQGAAGGL
jgi:hypothetical protein